jgi:hypothetical protein
MPQATGRLRIVLSVNHVCLDHDPAAGLVDPIDRDFRQMRQQLPQSIPDTGRNANADHHKIIARTGFPERRHDAARPAPVMSESLTAGLVIGQGGRDRL